MTAPLVSVVIPTRNRLSLLAQTLHTVLAQAVELEVIVVDEGSSDSTPGWLARQGDPRVRTIRHDDPRGLPAARNAGAAQARGRWVAFVDDDDLWLPDKLEAQLATADEHGRVWAYGGALDVTSEPRLLRIVRPSSEDADDLPWRNVVPGGGSNVVVQRDALEAAGPFDDIVADRGRLGPVGPLGPALAPCRRARSRRGLPDPHGQHVEERRRDGREHRGARPALPTPPSGRRTGLGRRLPLDGCRRAPGG
jgi:glycosyltransferase involved in cell wall biosynthesis